MMSSKKAPALLACVVILAAVSLRAADEPKDVAITFATALQKGDMKALHDISVGTADQVKVLDTMAEMMGGMTKFKAACDAKYGADNALSKGFGNVPDIVAEVKKNEIKVEGDSATMIDAKDPNDKHPLKFKKADGKWKVDLASMDEEMAKAAPPGFGKNLSELADEIKADKHKTVEDAAKALDAKMKGGQK